MYNVSLGWAIAMERSNDLSCATQLHTLLLATSFKIYELGRV